MLQKLLVQTYHFLSGKEKDASHISMTHAFLYSYFINLYFLCLLSVDNKISSEFQSLLEAVLLMEGKFEQEVFEALYEESGDPCRWTACVL